MSLNPAKAWMNRIVIRSRDPATSSHNYTDLNRVPAFATKVLIIASQIYFRDTYLFRNLYSPLSSINEVTPVNFYQVGFLFTTCFFLVVFITAMIVHIFIYMYLISAV